MTLKEIQNSNFLSDLEKVAENYNLKGFYAELTDSNGNSNVYFVTGKNISEEDITSANIIKNTQIPSHWFPTEFKAFPLSCSRADEYNCFNKIATYLDRLDTLTRVYNSTDNQIPLFLPDNVVSSICLKYANSLDFSLSRKEQLKYNKELKDKIKKPDKSQDNLIYGVGYDPTKSSLSNKFKKIFSKYPNQVSLKYMYEDEFRPLVTRDVRFTQKKKFMSALKEYPHISYAVTGKKGAIVPASNNKGFGSKEANDQRYCRFIINEDSALEFDRIANKISFPYLFQNKASYLEEEFGELFVLNLPFYEIPNFSNYCNELNISYCYAENVAHSQNVVPIYVPLCKENDTYIVLEHLFKDKLKNTFSSVAEQEFDSNKITRMMEQNRQDRVDVVKDILAGKGEVMFDSSNER